MKKYFIIGILFLIGLLAAMAVYYINTPELKAGGTGAVLIGETQNQVDCTSPGAPGPCDTHPCPEGYHWDETCQACVKD